jgi:thymidylate synthase
MFRCINGATANDVWNEAFNEIIKSETVNTRLGNSKEILHAALSINDPTQKWIDIRRPSISIGYALAELIWILNGKDESSTINFWNASLPKYAGDYEKYPGAYGYRIESMFGFDQLERAYNVLNNNSNSRQVVINIWNPSIDAPLESGEPANKDIPCNICSLIKIRNGKLEWTQIMRSNDLVRGLPYNIVQFTSLQEILASWLEIEIGSYNHLSDSLHIYEHDDAFYSTESSNIFNTDSLAIKKEDYRRVVGSIYEKMCMISSQCVSADKLQKLALEDTGYNSYNNILRIICVYAAYKYGYQNEKNNILASCTNQLYRNLWEGWEKSKMDGE